MSTDKHPDSCGICDDTGVIAVTDFPSSRVLVCPRWPIDADEPLAYWWAVEGLGYAGPATMQQRIRDRVMAEVARTQQIKAAPTSDQIIAQAKQINRAVVGIVIALISVAVLTAWTWAR